LVVSNLIRFINEFWFVNTEYKKSQVEEVVKSDKNLMNTTNLNLPILMTKIKYFDNLEVIYVNIILEHC
jgi:hypothetical protein